MAPCDFGYAACGQAPRGAQTSYVTYIGGMAQGPVGFTTGNADITTSNKSNPAILGAPTCFCAHCAQGGRCRWRWWSRSRALAIVREGITTGDAPPRAETSSRTTEGTGAHKWQLPDVELVVLLGGAVVGSWVWGGRQLWRGQRSR